jgi:hypothetical protein
MRPLAGLIRATGRDVRDLTIAGRHPSTTPIDAVRVAAEVPGLLIIFYRSEGAAELMLVLDTESGV